MRAMSCIACAGPPIFARASNLSKHVGLIDATGAALVEIGRHDQRWLTSVKWQNKKLKSTFSHMVVHQGCVFGFDGSILTCLDLKDGRRRWKGGRYGHGQLLLADDLLLIQAENGEVVFVEANPHKYVELARFPALTSKTWNHPVLAGRYLLVRNDREAACFELANVR